MTIEEIVHKSFLTSFKQWKLQHLYREANSCADALANRGGQSKANLTIFSSPPNFIQYLLLSDVLEIGEQRSIRIRSNM
ncbi:ethylene responsive transcription factor 1b [Senna tora]|uniref:Ethylene responsive transcription factor 1b n=1 Tax=Senna tora TaxID=362788 RepID=A0A834TQI2_9FABA|nr:ethylene responsive transcription factor 1b [Senna tora]